MSALAFWLYGMGCLLAFMYADVLNGKHTMGTVLFMAAWPVLVPIIIAGAIIKTTIDAVRS